MNTNQMDLMVKAFYAQVDDIFDYETFLSIWKKFSNYDDPEKRLLLFSVCELIQASKKIGHMDSLLSGIQIILISSIIEVLSSRKDWIKYDDWYNQNKIVEKNWNCVESWHKYNSVYGAGKNFRNFFSNLPIEDRMFLLTKLKKRYDKDLYAPFCYQSRDKCYYKLHHSIRNGDNINEIHKYAYECKGINGPQQCPALNDNKILNKGIKNFADHLYKIRSNFIHQSRLPDFSYPPPSYAEKGVAIETFYYYSIRKNYPKKKKNGKIIYEREHFLGTLTPKHLYDTLKKHLHYLFEKYLNEVIE